MFGKTPRQKRTHAKGEDSEAPSQSSKEDESTAKSANDSRRRLVKENSKRKDKENGSQRKLKKGDSKRKELGSETGIDNLDTSTKSNVSARSQELARARIEDIEVENEINEVEKNIFEEANTLEEGEKEVKEGEVEAKQSGREQSLTPIRGKPAMSGWKSGLEFEQKIVSKKKSATTSRYKRRASLGRKGHFQQRVKIPDAPHLMSVVNAKPEIKRKATEAVAEREEKMEEKKRKMRARIIVSKPSPKQAKRTWTSVLSPDKPVSTKGLKGKKPTGYKPPPGSIKTDWKSAYEDIVSPKSGKPKMVAKQDLRNENKILSPKKKSNRKAPKIPSFPPIDLDDGDQIDLPFERPSSRVQRESVADVAPKSRARPVTPPPKEEIESRISKEEVAPGLENVEEAEVKDSKKDDGLDDFVDINSEDSSAYEVATTGKNSLHSRRSTTLPDPTEDEPSTQPKVKPQLILEFALPAEDGEEDEVEGGLQVPVDLQSFDDLSSVGSWPSIMSDDSYDTKMNKMMQRWIDLHGGNQEDDRTLYDNDVVLEDNVLDHIVLATPCLEDAMAKFEELTGIRPTPVGPLQGLGAKTAHVGLDDNRYLEILAPDPDNPGPLGEELENLEKGSLLPYHYSIRSSEVSRLIEGYVYDVLGWDPDHIAMVQALPDSSIRQWDLLTMYGHDVGGVAPCYVKWKDPAQHPTATIALKATLTKCTVRAPENHDVHKLITGVGGIDVAYGEPLLECTFSTPKGSLTFSAANPTGLVFPGYDEDQPLSAVPGAMSATESGSIDDDYFHVGSDSESSVSRMNKSRSGRSGRSLSKN